MGFYLKPNLKVNIAHMVITLYRRSLRSPLINICQLGHKTNWSVESNRKSNVWLAVERTYEHICIIYICIYIYVCLCTCSLSLDTWSFHLCSNWQVHNSVECNYLGNAIALLCITFDGELPSNHFIKSTSKRIPTALSKIDKSWHKQHIKE